MTADAKYSLLNRDSLTEPIQMQFSENEKKKKKCSQFFFAFLKSTLNFEHLQIKDDPRNWCISEILDSEKQVKSMSNNSRLKGPFEKQHGKLAQTMLKSERQNLYHIYCTLWSKLSFKKSLLDIWKTLRLFVNTLTTDDKYSLLNSDNLTQPIQMQLSQKQKFFLNFCVYF